MKYQEAEDFFSEIYFGKHHLPSRIKSYGPTSWSIIHHGDLSTFDFDTLTRLVFLAHDRCCRISIEQGGIHSVKIIVWERKKRTGSMFERHPTIEDALKLWRKKHKKEERA